MTNSSSPEPGEAKTLTQRARWATRKMSVKSGRSKRMSILNRMHSRRRKTDEKPASGDGSDFFGDDVAPWAANPDEDAVRRLYFNIPLPDDMVDENGHPLASYPRNKIRTAKYTPLSFIPKNLWYQFHQIANIFFLFLVILVVSTAAHPLHAATVNSMTRRFSPSSGVRSTRASMPFLSSASLPSPPSRTRSKILGEQ